MKTKNLIMMLLALAGVFAMLPALADDEPQADFVIEKLERKKMGMGFATVTGIARNDTDEAYHYVQLEFNLFDKDGVQMGSTLANAQNIAPRAKWRFETMPFQAKGVAEVKLMNVTKF